MTRFRRDPTFLSKQDEYDLIVRWRDKKDAAALNRIVTAHDPLVTSTVWRFRKYNLPNEDLIQEGRIGLINALNHFDLDRGLRFSTLAMWYVRAALQDFVLRNYCIVRGPTSASAKLKFFSGQRATHASLDIPIGNEDGATWADILEDDGALPDEIAANIVDGERHGRKVKKALSLLPERSRIIIERRILSDEPDTLEALGTEFGISKERIRQIEAVALEVLRKALRVRV